jgi:hypothetical protein
MKDPHKRLQQILRSPANVRFNEFTSLVEAFGFRLLRRSASHHIFGRAGIPEQINLQEVNGKAKPYQIRQFLKIVERYNLSLEDG